MRHFKNILFVVDPELKSGDVLERAVSLAQNNQANLTLVSILDELPAGRGQKIHDVSISQLQDAMMDKRQLQLESLATSIQKKTRVNIKVLTGVHFLTLIREVLSHKRDLIIKTATQEGIIDRFFASSDMHLLRKCPCPVWLMRSSQQGHYQKIMAAVDFDPFDPERADEALNRRILEISTSLALSEFSELHIIHVWHAYGESSLRSGFAYQPEAYVDAYVERIRIKHQELLDELVTEFITRSDKEVANYLKPKIHLVKGVAKDMIPELVKKHQIELIMMGTVGRTGIPGFLMGNTAETVLNRIDCSVLAIKPEGFVTPVSIEE